MSRVRLTLLSLAPETLMVATDFGLVFQAHREFLTAQFSLLTPCHGELYACGPAPRRGNEECLEVTCPECDRAPEVLSLSELECGFDPGNEEYPDDFPLWLETAVARHLPPLETVLAAAALQSKLSEVDEALREVREVVTRRHAIPLLDRARRALAGVSPEL